MPNETYFQRQLCDAAKTLGGYGLKLSNAYLVGVPDLLLQVPTYPTTIAEVKRQEITDTTRVIRVGLTKMQHDRLVLHRDSGGHAGWIMVAHMRNGTKWVMASTDLGASHDTVFIFTPKEYKERSCYMTRNDPWTKPLAYALPILAARR